MKKKENDLCFTRLEVINLKKLSILEINKMKRAELFEYGNLEAWTAIGSNAQLAYSTHGAIRFFGKFPPPIATYLIHKYTDSDSLVIDPMAGSGTTAVECVLNERHCRSFDINPFMLLLARVKTTYIDEALITKHLKTIASKYKPKSFAKVKSSFKGLKDIDHWFLKETQDSLFGLKLIIDDIKDEKIREFFQVCFLSVIRRVSRATSQQGRLFLDVETAEKETFPFFEKKVEKLKKSISELPKKNKILIESRNLMDASYSSKNSNKADLIILHPPYFNSYKYSSVTSLEAYWMGINHADIRSNEIREFFKIGKPEKHEIFVEDMALCLSNAMKMLKPEGYLGFMMGDTVIKGQYIPIMKKTLEKAGITKKNIETIALRIPKYTEASWAASQRRNNDQVGITLNDFVVVLKK